MQVKFLIKNEWDFEMQILQNGIIAVLFYLSIGVSILMSDIDLTVLMWQRSVLNLLLVPQELIIRLILKYSMKGIQIVS